jgi:hypothetical protein
MKNWQSPMAADSIHLGGVMTVARNARTAAERILASRSRGLSRSRRTLDSMSVDTTYLL